jgi:DNA-binding NtrC family response regulator
VLLLARYFLRGFATARGVPVPSLGHAAEALLRRHAWPGNVRELESEMRRLVVFASGREVDACDLSPEIVGAETTGGGLRATLRRHEAEYVLRALERNGGVQARAAAELGITRQALCAKIRRLGPALRAACAAEGA